MSAHLHWFELGLLMASVACLPRDDAPSSDGAGTASAVWKDSLDVESRSQELARQYPIVFVSDRSGTGREGLYLMSPDAGGRDAVLVSAGEDHYMPRWAPNASSILIRRVVEGLSAEVGLIAPDGSQLVFLTNGEDPNAFAYPPNWSPDGERVSFGSLQAEGTRVWMVSRFGGAPERLLPSLDVEHREAVWSPDGSRLAYSAQTGNGRRRDLFVTESGGSAGAVNVTHGRVYAPGLLRWSPDGSRIAFSSATVLADGSPEAGAPSVDGSYVAPDNEVFVIDVESQELTRLTDNDVLDLAPAWSPDGSRVLFTSDRDGDADVWVVNLAAPDDAVNLIDDSDMLDPPEDSLADWYWGPPE